MSTTGREMVSEEGRGEGDVITSNFARVSPDSEPLHRTKARGAGWRRAVGELCVSMAFQTYLAVAIGGAIGAVARFGVIRSLTAWHGGEPVWSVLAINVLGSFGLGMAVTVLEDRQSPLAAFLLVGCLGAFTTFSTFALDAVTLYKERGSTLAGLYVGLSVGLAIAGFLLGHQLLRWGRP